MIIGRHFFVRAVNYIMEKLALKSVSALTIYAVVNGYVDINKI